LKIPRYLITRCKKIKKSGSEKKDGTDDMGWLQDGLIKIYKKKEKELREKETIDNTENLKDKKTKEKDGNTEKESRDREKTPSRKSKRDAEFEHRRKKRKSLRVSESAGSTPERHRRRRKKHSLSSASKSLDVALESNVKQKPNSEEKNTSKKEASSEDSEKNRKRRGTSTDDRSGIQGRRNSLTEFLRLSPGLPKATSPQKAMSWDKSAQARIVTPEMEAATIKYFDNLTFSPSSGSIEVNSDESYILVRAEALSWEFYSVIKQSFGNNEELAKEFSVNYLYDFARTIGRSDFKNFSTLIYQTPKDSIIAGGFLLNMAFLGWATGRIFAYDPSGVFNSTSPRERTDLFMMGVNICYSFEAYSWTAKHKKKASTPRCLLTAGYLTGWCEQNFNIPLIAVEVTCAAQGHDCCDFVIAHPNYLEHFVKAYMAHQKLPDSVTALDILAKTRSFSSKNHPGMGLWLNRILDRKLNLANTNN